MLERTEQTTKLYEIELAGATNIAGSRWDDRGDAADAGAERRLGGRDHAGARRRSGSTPRITRAIVGKTEGMTLLGDGALALINDDDFGITGARTQIVVIRGTGITRQSERRQTRRPIATGTSRG